MSAVENASASETTNRKSSSTSHIIKSDSTGYGSSSKPTDKGKSGTNDKSTAVTKKTKPVDQRGIMRHIDKSKPGSFQQARKLLHVFAKNNSQIDLKRYPREHFGRLQVTLLAWDFSRGIKRQDMTYVLIREGFENLWYLVEFFKKEDIKAAGVLAHLTRKIILMIEVIASPLEELSGVNVTAWTRVAEIFNKEARRCDSQDPPYLTAKLKYFEMGRLLGAGGFGAVFKSFIGHIECTLKLVPCERLLEPKYACMDKLVASMCNHPCLVKYYACFATRKCFVTAMEYVKGCDLNKVLTMAGHFQEKVTCLIVAQLGEALQHMHSSGFIHRDVKPANIMIINGCRIKLIDFDTAKTCIGKFVSKDQVSFNWRTSMEFNDGEVAGTMPYFPPECVMYTGYGRAMDWWATGVTTFQLATGRLPFHHFRSENDLQRMISTGYYQWPQDRYFSAQLQQLVADLMKKRPYERLCSNNYADFRAHTFFSSIDWNVLLTVDFLKDLPIINQCMGRTANGYSPVGSPQAEARRRNLFPNQIMDTTEHYNLYTYSSPGFVRAMHEIKMGKTPTQEVIYDKPYVNEETDLAFKFENV